MISGAEGAIRVYDLEFLREVDGHSEVTDSSEKGVEDLGGPEAVGDKVPGEDGIEVCFFLALESFTDEEGCPGDEGGEEQDKHNGGAPGAFGAAFFEGGDEKDGDGEESSEAGKVDATDGGEAEF